MELHFNNTSRRQAFKSGRTLSVGPTTARYLILVLLAIFSLLYLIEAAQGSDGLIQLGSLGKQKAEIDKQLTTLQVNDSRLRSAETLSQSANQFGLVPVQGSLESVTVPAKK